MKKCFITLLILTIAAVGFACGGTGGSFWENIAYDVESDATLNDVLEDLAALSEIPFSVEPELQAALDDSPVDLPTLTGLNAAQVLTVLQDTMPHELAFLYEEREDGSILLRPRFQQAEDLSGADPVTILEFDGFSSTAAAFVGEPLFEESCDDPVGTILDLLGSGGTFGITAEVLSDPSGHSEFIGTLPSSVDLAIDVNTIDITGDAPWVNVSGNITEDGDFTCSGSGVVAGFSDILVTFDGNVTPDGLFGTLTMGAGGGLPGGEAAVYSVSP